jgi:hypothetical protein
MKGLQRSSLSATLLYYRWHYEKSAYEILNPHLLFSLLQFPINIGQRFLEHMSH